MYTMEERYFGLLLVPDRLERNSVLLDFQTMVTPEWTIRIRVASETSRGEPMEVQLGKVVLESNIRSDAVKKLGLI